MPSVNVIDLVSTLSPEKLQSSTCSPLRNLKRKKNTEVVRAITFKHIYLKIEKQNS